MRRTTEENRGCSERIHADGFFHGGGATSDTILKKKHIIINNMSKFFINFFRANAVLSWSELPTHI